MPAQDDCSDAKKTFRLGALLQLGDNIEPDSLEGVQTAPRIGLPKSVCWELTFDPDGSKLCVFLWSQMGSKVNPLLSQSQVNHTHKCDLKSIPVCISRPHETRPRLIVSTGKSRWNSQIRMEQLLPSKARAESGKLEQIRGITRLYC